MKRTRLTLAHIARREGVAISTVWRWTLKGVKGRRLKSFLIGGRRYVNPADWEAFKRPQEDHLEIIFP